MIRYRIIQDIEQLKKRTAKELIEENEVYGFFNIKFKEHQIGFYLSEIELPLDYAIENNIYVYHDCLLWWFESIYKVLRGLECHSVVKLLDLESSKYGYVFQKNKEILEIKSVQVDQEYASSIIFDDDRYSAVEFSEVVNYLNFIDDYKNAFTSLRDELISINNNFEKLQIIKEINEWIRKIKSK